MDDSDLVGRIAAWRNQIDQQIIREWGLFQDHWYHPSGAQIQG